MSIITNLAQNPWTAIDTTWWDDINATLSRSTAWSYAGPASLLVTADAIPVHVRHASFATTGPHIWRYIIRNTSTDPRTFRPRRNLSDGTGDDVVIPAGDTAEVIGTYTGDGSVSTFRVIMLDGSAGDTFHVGHLQIQEGTELGPVTPEIDESGDLLPGSAWTGTPHASTSILTLPDTAPHHSRVFRPGFQHRLNPMRVGRR